MECSGILGAYTGPAVSQMSSSLRPEPEHGELPSPSTPTVMGRFISSTSSSMSRGLKRCAAMIMEIRKSRATNRNGFPSGKVTVLMALALLVRGKSAHVFRREREPPCGAVPPSGLLSREISSPRPECDGSTLLADSMLRDDVIGPLPPTWRTPSERPDRVQQRP